ncbi:MAG TPA: carbohydrate kinase [Gammaproteobacteria bacterium]|nr:carbohydrate kinase [Gammaproteobacteria bacterium]
MPAAHSHRPLIFGEVLFDTFPDGSVVLGGAPFNVAWHLAGFGLNPRFISRVGDDELGRRVLAAMGAWQMDTTGVQIDPAHPTGRVSVSVEDGEPSFDILPQQAYDFIEPPGQLPPGPALLYHGSLIARAARSRETLASLRDNATAGVFVDINLRPPWWDRATVEWALGGARWVKLNHHELATVLGHDSVPAPELAAAADSLRRCYELALVVVTRGEQGALFCSAGTVLTVAPPVVAEVVDTVGAGDAFAAVTLTGLIKGWPLETVAQRAVAFAAALCRQRGATAPDHELYRETLRKWEA